MVLHGTPGCLRPSMALTPASGRKCSSVKAQRIETASMWVIKQKSTRRTAEVGVAKQGAQEVVQQPPALLHKVH